MAQAPVKPLVAIVGATGTGKSDLAVEIARRYNGEIINGDAMQLYHGLPIITNKITQDEMRGVPHHLLGCIGLEEETWTVSKFVGKALGVIDEIRSRGKLPILVGGTHYYTQSLLFQDRLTAEAAIDPVSDSKRPPILDEPTDVILERLQEVDPVMASRWHPNDRRKIQRSLEIFLKTGRPASQIYDEQRINRELGQNINDQEGGAHESSTSDLRYPTLLFWVHASKDVLSPRLDMRITKMLDRGLLTEVETLTNFRNTYEARQGTRVDQSRGIWVSIGYKEFLEYQAALADPSVSATQLEKLRIAAIEKTQAATRQYAKRQVNWIRIKLLNALYSAGQKKNMFLLDASDLSVWEDQILKQARDITERFLVGRDLPQPTELSDAALEMLNPKRNYDLSQRPDLWEKKTCDTCGSVFVNENDWSLHIKSRAHKRAVGAKKKQEGMVRASKDKKAVQTDLVDVLDKYVETFPDADSPS